MVSVRDMPYTVTNSFKRGLMMKTYSRPIRRVLDGSGQEPATKRRRVQTRRDSDENQSRANLEGAIRDSFAAIQSSPSRRNSATFSSDVVDDEDDDDGLSTPPSSPPAATATLQLTPPPANTRKPTFSFLKRKRNGGTAAAPSTTTTTTTTTTKGGTPLAEVNSNSVRSSSDTPRRSASEQQQQQQQPQQQHTQQTQRQAPLKQTQIDLGGDVRKTCTGCGMEYVPSNTEDVALHRRFHDMDASGVDLGRAFVKANASRWVYEAARFDEGYVVIVDRKGSPAAKNQAKRVLEVVNRDLSATEIEDSVLWSQTSPPKRLRKNGSKEETDRFKVFLHMKDSKCVGLCLTERIWEAHPVKRNPTNSSNNNTNGNSSSVAITDEIHPAVVGISRVWTSASSRRKGIAMDLLDCVIGNFFYGVELPKSQIAFSQPTESGCRLLDAFYGDDEPWHIYKES